MGDIQDDDQAPWYARTDYEHTEVNDDEDREPGILPDTIDTYAWIGISIIATTALLIGALAGGLFAVWLYTH
ncbi:hypothetical protein B5566_02630 [Mycobacterium sp. MHSD3]|nr:hypothetical protein B5566_02630 [Mycobacterium sp. MHSD3]